MQLCTPEQANVSEQQLSRLNASMQRAVDRGRLNGIQVLLARRDKPFHFASFGWQDKENDVPMADDTIFRIYSMTKPIVSVATMMLFEEGRLQISDPVGEYLPAFHNLKVYIDENTTANLDRPVLIRDLLMHTAGLTYGFDESHPVDRMYAERPMSSTVNCPRRKPWTGCAAFPWSSSRGRSGATASPRTCSDWSLPPSPARPWANHWRK